MPGLGLAWRRRSTPSRTPAQRCERTLCWRLPGLRARAVWVRLHPRCSSQGLAFAGWARRACRLRSSHCQTEIFAARRWCSSPTCRWAGPGSSRRARARTGFRKCVRGWALSGRTGASNCDDDEIFSSSWWKLMISTCWPKHWILADAQPKRRVSRSQIRSTPVSEALRFVRLEWKSVSLLSGLIPRCAIRSPRVR